MAPRPLLRIVGPTLLLASAALGADAAAQPGGATAVADALFQQARELFKQQRYAEACPKFAESQRLEPKLGTQLNLAVCHEREGKLATARAEYVSAAAIARREGQKEREDFAREQIAALDQKVARVTIKMDAPPAGLTLALDDQPLTGALLNTPLPVDPGKHRVSVTAPGKEPWSTTIDVPAQKADLAVTVPALAAAAPAPSASNATPPPTATATPLLPPTSTALPPQPPPERRDYRWLTYGGFGLGAAGLLVGAITGGLTLAKTGEIRDACGGDQCPPTQQDAIDSANTLANVSNAAFVIGALGVGAGITGLILSRPRAAAPPQRTGVAVTPVIGPGAIGLRGSF